MNLVVDLYGTTIGTLEATDARRWDFAYSADARQRFGATSRVLSVAIPLAPVLPRQHAGRRRAWFGELLPEGDQLDYLLAQATLRRGDTLGFLAAYGRDVAGALQIWDADDPTEPRVPGLRRIDDRGVRGLLEDPIGAPLGNLSGLGRSSLGGVQPKIVLVRDDGGWAQALGGYPSTHIIKPQLATHPTVIHDEEYGARLARQIGAAHFGVELTEFDGLPALVIERFDRDGGERVHQEDFNQVLGASGNQKYQELGGVVSLARVADAVTRFTPAADLVRLARMVVLATAIGNLDLHTKNLGVLHPSDGTTTLAPAYDQVPLAHLPGTDGRMALAVNRKYRHAEISRDDLVIELTGWGLRRAAAVVDEALAEIAAAVAQEVPSPGAHPQLHDAVKRFTSNLRGGRPAGELG